MITTNTNHHSHYYYCHKLSFTRNYDPFWFFPFFFQTSSSLFSQLFISVSILTNFLKVKATSCSFSYSPYVSNNIQHRYFILCVNNDNATKPKPNWAKKREGRLSTSQVKSSQVIQVAGWRGNRNGFNEWGRIILYYENSYFYFLLII